MSGKNTIFKIGKNYFYSGSSIDVQQLVECENNKNKADFKGLLPC